MIARRSHRGFTLLEVLVALVIVAFGMGALMATLTSAADAVGHLRDKSFAEWVALNRISELRLQPSAPAVGDTRGETEYAGLKWQWTQKVERTGLADMIRIDVSVSRKAEAPGEKAPPVLAAATGFVGGSLRPAAGAPDWSGGDFEQSFQQQQQQQQGQQQSGQQPAPQQPQQPGSAPPPLNQPAARQ